MCEQKQTPPVKVEVKNLTKKFGDLLVLDNISFDVYQGDLLCVVGPTGCGKTTFLNSLTKIYDITSGQILLDGKPVDPKTNNIAYIFQGDSTMPWLTVEQNVAFGLDIKHVPKARRDELVAKYLDIVGLTKYKSYYPKQLSSSMLQRVSIARALLKNAPILLLDEATSALDTESEKYIQASLDKLREGRTSFVVAHRLSTIVDADMIVVMDQGAVVEAGTHFELLENDGPYARLYKIQFSHQKAGKPETQEV